MKMRIVPAEPTEQMATRAADKMLYPSVYMGGTPALAVKQAADILGAGLAVAPSAGRVSREAVERVARAIGSAYEPPIAYWWVDEVPTPSTHAMREDDRAGARAAIAALGLEMEGEGDAG